MAFADLDPLKQYILTHRRRIQLWAFAAAKRRHLGGVQLDLFRENKPLT